MRIHAAIAAAAAWLLPAQATAQARQAPSFTGAHLEALVGYDRVPATRSLTGDGLLYGIGAGYDIGLNLLRLGVEAEAADSTARGCLSPSSNPDALCLRFERDLYVGGRIGMQISPGLLLYAKGGYANFRRLIVGSVGGVDITNHFNVDGFRVGAGAERAITRRAFMKAEYRYSHYEGLIDRHQVVLGFGLRL